MRAKLGRLGIGAAATAIVLAFPGGALAGGEYERNCDYAQGESDNPEAQPGREMPLYTTNDLNKDSTDGDQEVVIYTGKEGQTGTAAFLAGACVNLDGPATFSVARVDGGTVEAGGIEDPAPFADGAGDPEGVDVYVIADGDEDNYDPTGRSNDYAGFSNYESGDVRDANCADGPDQGEPDSSNSGRCLVIVPTGTTVTAPWVLFPVCGDGSWSKTSRDGCVVP